MIVSIIRRYGSSHDSACLEFYKIRQKDGLLLTSLPLPYQILGKWIRHLAVLDKGENSRVCVHVKHSSAIVSHKEQTQFASAQAKSPPPK